MRSVLVAILVGISTASAGAADLLCPAADYQASRTNAVTYEVDFSIVVTPLPTTRELKVWLPMPQSDIGQQVGESRLTSFPLRVEPQIGVEPEYGNKFACFVFDAPAGAQIVRHRFTITIWELRWHLDADRVRAPSVWPASFDPFRRGDPQAVVVDERFAGLVRQIVPQPGNPWHDMVQVMRWVNANFEYDHQEASLRASSTHGLENRRGHCSDYHGFCASMGRAMGYPTRVTYGIHTFAKNSPSHCKLEAFLPPYGWVSFDVSETQRMIRRFECDPTLDAARRRSLIDAADRRLAAGFRDNTWFCLTRGTNYQLVPPASDRVPVVRTAYVEADGEPLDDPDPANQNERKFSWMTVHEYRPDRPVSYPFEDITSLEE